MTLLDRKSNKNQGITALSAPRERGSAIMWILIMVALLGMLAYAMSDGTQTGVRNMTEQQASMAASEILDYAGSLKRVIRELQINGCEDTEISFDNAVIAGYSNPNAPSDNSCHVFHPRGGGLRYIAPEDTWLDDSFSAQSLYKQWNFTSSPQIDGVGTNAAELKAGLPFLRTDLCMALNDRLNITNPSNAPPVDSNDPGSGLFTGTYGAPVGNNIGDDGGHNISGNTAFCRTGNTSHQFMQVLIVR